MALISWSSASDVGLVRGTNEDCLLARPPVFVVADGMGGHAAGEVASALAVAAFESLAGQETVTPEAIQNAVLSANATIVETARDDQAGMGTTIAGIALVSSGGVEHWFVFSVGDSRVYRSADGTLAQITVDHSEVQELVAAGELTADEARTHRSRSVLTRSLGMDPPPEIDSWLLPVVPQDIFVICSDGVYAEIGEGGIRDALARPSATEFAQNVVDAAVTSGGHDNATAVVVRVDAVGSASNELDEDTKPRLVVPDQTAAALINEVPPG